MNWKIEKCSKGWKVSGAGRSFFFPTRKRAIEFCNDFSEGMPV